MTSRIHLVIKCALMSPYEFMLFHPHFVFFFLFVSSCFVKEKFVVLSNRLAMECCFFHTKFSAMYMYSFVQFRLQLFFFFLFFFFFIHPSFHPLLTAFMNDEKEMGAEKTFSFCLTHTNTMK